MSKYLKTLLIVITLITASVNLSKASDNDPKDVNGDCSECINNPDYLEYSRQAEAGSMVATYQAAAALINCYIQNGCYGNSTGYTYDQLMEMYKLNMQTAEELGGDQPYIRLPDSEPENNNQNYEDNNSGRDSDNGTVRSAK